MDFRELFELGQIGWYDAQATRESAQRLLRKRPVGGFIVRPSSQTGFLALSYRTGGMKCIHSLIAYCAHGYYFESRPEEQVFPSLRSLLLSCKFLAIEDYNATAGPSGVYTGLVPNGRHVDQRDASSSPRASNASRRGVSSHRSKSSGGKAPSTVLSGNKWPCGSTPSTPPSRYCPPPCLDESISELAVSPLECSSDDSLDWYEAGRLASSTSVSSLAPAEVTVSKDAMEWDALRGRWRPKPSSCPAAASPVKRCAAASDCNGRFIEIRHPHTRACAHKHVTLHLFPKK
eukprot:TRINITY_DN849_c0_g1_i3.p1 TRINITY_DN849_c0_g1~~TRINITY_DN849_c0_g1_i3.p1  ORF type:complete len:289 (-),score=22.62 TRINITY_DN849_c0_g1_i3:884-1750(-)